MAIKKSLFMSDYVFKGSHCDKVLALTSKIDADSNTCIFSSSVELFIFAALVGCYFNRRCKPERSSGKETKIMVSQFIEHKNDINLAFRFVLLTGNRENADPVERLNRTFRNPETDDNYALFEEYMLGGVDEIYEHLILSSNTHYEDYLTSLNKFLNEIRKNDEEEGSKTVSTEDFF